jgi:dienelactone hydrolase
MRRRVLLVVVMPLALLGGCLAALEAEIFPVWPANFFDEPPAELGARTVSEFRIQVPDGADGEPAGLTVFAPADADSTPLPLLLWVTGSNVQAYYHQSLHETLASWGYVVVVPDGRPLTFTDQRYHRRTVDLARQALDLALAGDLGYAVNPERIAAGGYSIGGTLAAVLAGEDPRVDAVVLWAPTSSPFWTGVDPAAAFAEVSVPVFYLLAEFDHVEPPEGYSREMAAAMPQATVTREVIPQGLHLYFQQPTGADRPGIDPESELTRFEQQGIAIEATRAFLAEAFGINPATP